MAEPKKKLSATRSGKRRSHLYLTPNTTTTCSHCHAVIIPHTVCLSCGYYRGKLVLPKKAKTTK